MQAVDNSFPRLSLAAARVNANLTQKEFAEKCGVCESTIVAWEAGRRYPSTRMLSKIEQALGISLNYIKFGN